MNNRTLILIQICFKLCFGSLSGLSYTPHTGNIAIGRSIMASSTCGQHGPEEYCPMEAGLQCDTCDSLLDHPPSSMIDPRDSVHSSDRTWWQSANNVSNVRVDVDFMKKFFFTHILLSFKSIKPALLVLEKSNDRGTTYTVLQYYSKNCEQEFGLPDNQLTMCTSEYSQAEVGEIVYTIDAAHSHQLDLSNTTLVDHLTITNLRIRLLGFHKISGSEDNRRIEAAVRQYYAIYNLEVFGWCFCNGHETDCQYLEEELDTIGAVPSSCLCANDTTGQHCDQCLPLFNDSPWESGFQSFHSGCRACECNGHSESCMYSEERNGGVCDECLDDTTGDSCELCLPGYYKKSTSTCEECRCSVVGTVPNTVCDQDGTCACKDNVMGMYCDECRPGHFNLDQHNDYGCQECDCESGDCEPYTGRCNCSAADPSCCAYNEVYDSDLPGCVSCGCHPTGSHGACTENATCICKAGVGGDKCDRCLPGYHSLGEDGCSRCSCNRGGSTNPDTCNVDTGQCDCLDNITGLTCDTCPDGMLGPVEDAVAPCISCYCDGYSVNCSPRPNWYQALIVDEFKNVSHIDEWQSNGAIDYIPGEGLVTLAFTNNSQALSVTFPTKYLGDKRTSYGSYLTFDMNVDSEVVESIYLRMNGEKTRRSQVKLSASLEGIRSSRTEYKIGFTPDGFVEESFFVKDARKKDLRISLSRLMSIELLVSFVPGTPVERRQVAIDNIRLPYSTMLDSTNPDIIYPLRPSLVTESCQCPAGRRGENCEACTEGYTHDPPNDEDEFLACVKCFCYGYSNECDPMTGDCMNCHNHTAGRLCDVCADGYYKETPTSNCLPCDCPGGPGTANQFADTCSYVSGSVVCDCGEGYGGAQCEVCDEGYVGNPRVLGGSCRVCTCNNNARGGMGGDTCDDVTGQCLCSEGYIGETCHLCDLGYHGDPLSHNCTACDCHPSGTVEESYCDIQTGVCLCIDNVEGDDCSQCSQGYWNIGEGCVACNCTSNAISCDQISGECECKEGYSGDDCGECDDGYWSNKGNCTACDCSPPASVPPYCDKETGQCLCLPGVMGERCDSCLPSGTTGVLPYCMLCDECSAQWDVPLVILEIVVMDYANLTEELMPIPVPHTQHKKGPDLIDPIIDGLDNISLMLDDIEIGEALNDSIELYNYIGLLHNTTLVLISNAQALNESIHSENNSISLLLYDIESAAYELNDLQILIQNLTSETEAIMVANVSNLIGIINQSKQDTIGINATIENAIIPKLMESNETHGIYFAKEVVFLLLSNKTSEVLQNLEEKVFGYRDFMLEADSYICGREQDCAESIDLLCGGYGDGERCGGACGGVECASCGGEGCNDIMQLIEQTRNTTHFHFQQASVLHEVFTKRVESLTSLSNSSQIMLVNIIEIKGHIEETINISDQLTTAVSATTSSLEARLNDTRNNISQIEAAEAEVLALALPYTPEQVLELLVSINNTVGLFPEIAIRNEEELVTRIEDVLTDIQIANNTYLRLKANISTLTERTEHLKDNIISLTNATLRVERSTNEVSAIITENGASLVSLNQKVINVVEEMASVISYYQLVLRKSEASIQSFNEVMAQYNLNLEWANQIDNSTVLVNNLTNQTNREFELVNATLVNAMMLYNRMKALQARTHTQMLEARGLYNRKDCLVLRREHIHQHLLRLSSEIEIISDDIAPHIARNTLCMRGTSTS